ncbi:hypothetical protein PMAYCL1PPCAC_18093, partial [Pristionchus mayeri]
LSLTHSGSPHSVLPSHQLIPLMEWLLFLSHLLLLHSFHSQKILVIIAEGLGGSEYHKYSEYNAFQRIEEGGVWSTKLFPVYPTLPLPNRYSLFTGLSPRKHRLISDQMYNWRSGESFSGFSSPSDLDYSQWWGAFPLFLSAQRQKARVAMLYFPECQVNWPFPPKLCISTKTNLTLQSEGEIDRVIEMTQLYDLILIHDSSIFDEFSRMGPKRAGHSGESVRRLTDKMERIVEEARKRVDLNLIFVSLHGIIEVPPQNERVVDEYLPMEMVKMTVGEGASMQIVPRTGATHQIFSQLRNNFPIPNVSIHFTAPKVGDLPHYFTLKLSPTVSDLVLLADPGCAVYTKDQSKRFPTGLQKKSMGLAGFNGKHPEMLGLFMAYGPLFRRRYEKSGVEVVDIYVLLCTLLKIQDCNPTTGSIRRVQDILVKDVVNPAPMIHPITLPLLLMIY